MYILTYNHLHLLHVEDIEDDAQIVDETVNVALLCEFKATQAAADFQEIQRLHKNL